MKSKFFGHLKTVTKHRFVVLKHCIKCGIIWRGLVHDLSKFSPVEWRESVKYYSGVHSPITDSRLDKGYSLAWIHHKNHNKHHIEYWYDEQNDVQMPMPLKYAIEYICDCTAACKVYNGKNYTPEIQLNYQINTLEHKNVNPKMKEYFLQVFSDLVKYGEKVVFKKKYLKQKYMEIVEGK